MIVMIRTDTYLTVLRIRPIRRTLKTRCFTCELRSDSGQQPPWGLEGPATSGILMARPMVMSAALNASAKRKLTTNFEAAYRGATSMPIVRESKDCTRTSYATRRSGAIVSRKISRNKAALRPLRFAW